jgi:hypothetical protein
MWCDPARRAAWQLQYDRERKRPDYVPRFVARRMKKLARAAGRVAIEKTQTTSSCEPVPSLTPMAIVGSLRVSV